MQWAGQFFLAMLILARDKYKRFKRRLRWKREEEIKSREMPMQDYKSQWWIKVPVAELIKPKPWSYCIGPAWWAITYGDYVLFWNDYTHPQCSESKEDIEYMHPGCVPLFIELAYIPYAVIKEYV